jgi:hypothetical protein
MQHALGIKNAFNVSRKNSQNLGADRTGTLSSRKHIGLEQERINSSFIAMNFRLL